MNIYIVTNVRPNLQVFTNLEEAKNFALTKAKKRRCTNVWLNWETDYQVACLNPEICGESHIYIYKREVN